MWSTKEASNTASSFIDGKLAALAGAIDVVSGNVKNAAQGNDNVQYLADSATSRVDMLENRVREQSGQELVEATKRQMVAHPVATVGVAALAGAIIAQAAIVAFRSEKKGEMKDARKLKTGGQPPN